MARLCLRRRLLPVSGYGWTVDPGEDDGYTGHDEIAPTPEDALEAVRSAFAAS
ncbi:hypothetical protein GCM10009760_24980 [Kitasatospora kazusensis]|uniref:DUF2188 domain-containing protein n=1 Tax=Kitasatospora kazusensis TaxID=407974 RepID=A0ABP5L614_9ACTN